jgi:hypothetical protein
MFACLRSNVPPAPLPTRQQNRALCRTPRHCQSSRLMMLRSCAISLPHRVAEASQWGRKETLLNPNHTRRPTQFPLRLGRSLKQAAGVVAKEQGISLNHFISLVVAEKISRIEKQAESSANSDSRSGP